MVLLTVSPTRRVKVMGAGLLTRREEVWEMVAVRGLGLRLVMYWVQESMS